MKYPIGIQSFDRIREDGFVYVDKTDMVYSLVHEGSIYFLSRPRRFGKSLLVSTLACYFQGRRELFDGLAIASLEKDWLTYPIFRIDFNGGPYTQPGILEATLESYIAKWEVVYGKDPLDTTLTDRFRGVLRRAYEQTGLRAVVLIDEYDKPILDVLDTGASTLNSVGRERMLEDQHRELLAAFYSTFKGADEYLKFVLLTGVTKFSQVSVFSGFNQPKDISMDKRYETLCGITPEEMERYFAEPIATLADAMQCTVEEMKAWLKRQYDGYHFSTNMADIYNPFSILNAFDKQEIRDYWFATGTPSYLIRLLQHSREHVNELVGKYYRPALFVDYKADVEQPLPMIYQSGYLTMKEYNARMGTYLLDFPNNEVREGFLSLLSVSYFKPKSKEVSSWITDAVTDLDRGDTDAFRRSLTAFPGKHPLRCPRLAEGYRHHREAFPVHFLPVAAPDRRLQPRHPLRRPPKLRPGGLHDRAGRLCLHLRVQTGRNSPGSSGTDRADGVCQTIRSGPAESDLYRHELLFRYADCGGLGGNYTCT